MDLKVESGIPIPATTGARKGVVYAMRTMEVGDSFALPKGKQNQIPSLTRLAPGRKFITRSIDESTIRIWRTA